MRTVSTATRYQRGQRPKTTIMAGRAYRPQRPCELGPLGGASPFTGSKGPLIADSFHQALAATAAIFLLHDVAERRL
jgi:hypothetical protein